MEITHTTADTYTGRIRVINVNMPTTGDELADLRTAKAAADAENGSPTTWVGNDYAATGKTATFTFEV